MILTVLAFFLILRFLQEIQSFKELPK